MARLHTKVASYGIVGGVDTPHYPVIGWKCVNDYGRTVRCNEDDADIAVLRIKGQLVEEDVRRLIFCPAKEFLGQIG